MKKFGLVIAIVVSLGLVGSLFASPASAFFFAASVRRAAVARVTAWVTAWVTGWVTGWAMVWAAAPP